VSFDQLKLKTYTRLPTNTKLLHSKPQCSVLLIRPLAETDVTIKGVFPPKHHKAYIIPTQLEQLCWLRPVKQLQH